MHGSQATSASNEVSESHERAPKSLHLSNQKRRQPSKATQKENAGKQAVRSRQNYEVAYINLAHRIDRRRDMERSLRAVGVDASRFEAITGEVVPEEIVQLTWDSTLNAEFDVKMRPHPAVRMTAGERGCCMSHAVLWSNLASKPLENSPLLVLEDDVLFEEGFADGVARIVQLIEQSSHPSQRTILAYLGAHVAEWSNTSPRIPVGDGRVLREARYLWQTHSYIIWPAAARGISRNPNLRRQRHVCQRQPTSPAQCYGLCESHIRT